jgi:hypothetical protein
MDFVTLHALKPHPDIGLDVLHDVADVKRPVRIGKRRRDEKAAAAGRGSEGCGHRGKPCAGQGEATILANGPLIQYRPAAIFANIRY